MEYLSNPARTSTNSTGVPPNIFEKSVARSINWLVTSNAYPFLFIVFATMPAVSPVPINRTFFLPSIPAFSSAILTATSPIESVFSATLEEFLIVVAILIALSNNLFNILPECLIDLAV